MRQICCHVGDEDIKLMLAQHSLQFPVAPENGNNVAFLGLVDTGRFWVVAKYYYPEDPGYVAYGIEETASEQERVEMVRLVMDEILAQNGGKYELMPFGEVKAN